MLRSRGSCLELHLGGQNPQKGSFLAQEQWLAMGATPVFGVVAVVRSCQLHVPVVNESLKVNDNPLPQIGVRKPQQSNMSKNKACRDPLKGHGRCSEDVLAPGEVQGAYRIGETHEKRG